MIDILKERIKKLEKDYKINKYDINELNAISPKLVECKNLLEQVKKLNIVDVSSSYDGKESRPIKFAELELMLIRYRIIINTEPERYTEAEFLQQEDYRRKLFK